MDVKPLIAEREQKGDCVNVPRISGCMDARLLGGEVFKFAIQVLDLKRAKRAAEEMAVLDQASLT